MNDDDLTPTPLIDDEKTQEIGLQALAAISGLNRRTTERIQYPSIVVNGPYPKLEIQSLKLILLDISVGGFALNAAETSLNIAVGDELHAEISWPNTVIHKRAIMVNRSSTKFHFSWSDPFPELEIWLAPFQLPAAVGARITQVHCYLENVTLEAEEIWLGPTGELITFTNQHHNHGSDVFLKWESQEVCIFREPFLIQTEGPKLSRMRLAQWIILLGQIATPTPNLTSLMQSLGLAYERLLITGGLHYEP